MGQQHAIEYSLISDDKPPTNLDNLIIFHEYSTFSQERFKSFSNIIYRCGYGAVVNAIQECSGYKILTVSLDKKNSNMVKCIYKYFDMVIETNNVGQDFGGYFSAIKEVRSREWNFNTVTLVNSSQFLSSNSLVNFINTKIDKNYFMGISWGYGPKFKIKKHLHLQSFLLKYHFSSLLKILDKTYKLDRFYNSKYNLIDKGEVELSKQSINQGLIPVVFKENRLESLNTEISSFFHYDHRINIDFDD